jgi:hypothetical protein
MAVVLFDVGAKRLRVSFEDVTELSRRLRRSRQRESRAALREIADALRGSGGNIVVLSRPEAGAVWHVIGRWEEAPASLRVL